jgi:hypothetical protein
VFFDSAEALVPQATNGLIDVYEWERDGAGSCQRAGGCVYLLSSGTSTDNSYFTDASENGDDVFFVSRAKLAPQDEGETLEMYDARVGASQRLVSPQCTGMGCQGVPEAPPIFATPSSVTFDGVGNFAAAQTSKAKAKRTKKPKVRKKPKKKRRGKTRRASRRVRSAERRIGAAGARS